MKPDILEHSRRPGSGSHCLRWDLGLQSIDHATMRPCTGWVLGRTTYNRNSGVLGLDAILLSLQATLISVTETILNVIQIQKSLREYPSRNTPHEGYCEGHPKWPLCVVLDSLIVNSRVSGARNRVSIRDTNLDQILPQLEECLTTYLWNISIETCLYQLERPQ